MTRHRSASRALALLERFVPDDDPLAGDLIERAHECSNAWLWRQVLLALLLRALDPFRASPRSVAERALVATAMLGLLGFHAVVCATLMNHLLGIAGPGSHGWAGLRDWQLYATIPAFAVAVAIGRAIGRLHRGHRLLTILASGASATAAAFLNVYLFAPAAADQILRPGLALQIGAAMVFIAGVFVGIGSRARWQAAFSR